MTTTTDYIHGFTAQEQARLDQQAAILEQAVHSGVDFTGRRRIVELGSGVGSQTKILLRNFPGLFIQSVERQPAQLRQAAANLAQELAQGRVELTPADASRLPFADASFDGAFVCWLLEHVAEPLAVLKEARRVLKPGAVIHGIEVMNSSLWLSPDSPATMAYWNAFNAIQERLGGDPFIGAKLGGLLARAGFTAIVARPYGYLFDQRDPARLAAKLDYWHSLLLSAAPQLLESGDVDAETIAAMGREFSALKAHPDAVFHYTPFKFKAEAPS